MIINLKIEDSLYDHYLTKFGSPGHWNQMKRAIEAFSNIGSGDRTLILAGEARKALEKEFGTLLETPEKLLRLVKNLKSVKIHGIEVSFTDDELARIASQASFHGRSTETYIIEMINELKGRMLESV